MPADHPWSFGWTQFLTLIGFAITIGIAVGGFRTFNRWKREKIEERRMDIAMEALSLVYETKVVFRGIRSPLIQGWEMDQLGKPPNVPADKWERAIPHIAILKRIEANKDYFDRLWKLQPRFMAAFGPETEECFSLVHQSRRDIEVAADMLMSEGDYRRMDEGTLAMYERMRRDLADLGGFEPEKEVINKRLDEFKERMERICRPIIDQQYATELKAILIEGKTQAEFQRTKALLESLKKRIYEVDADKNGVS